MELVKYNQGPKGFGERRRIRRPVSRVLCRPFERPERTRRPFLWTAHCWTVLATYPDASDRRRSCRLPGATSLFGLAPGGACRAASIAGDAVRSYRTLSPLPSGEPEGGLLSVALSLGSPPAGVTRRHVVVEPGLSSLAARRERPPGRLIRMENGRPRPPGQSEPSGAP